MTTDRVAGATLVLIGLVAIWESRAFPLGSLHRPGPAYMPVFLAGLLIVFGVAVRRWGRAPGGSWTLAGTSGGTRWRSSAPVHSRRGGSSGSATGSRWRSCSSCSSSCSSGSGLVLGLALTVVMSWGSFYLFDTLLKVPLPRGPFGF